MPQPPMIRVSSSYVHSVGYDAERMQLYVSYQSLKGRRVSLFTARYDDVPFQIYQELMAAPSKGKYAVRVLHRLTYREV